MIDIPAPTLEHVANVSVAIAAPIEVGDTRAGLRRVIPITGGEVRGPRLSGRVLAAGADFQAVHPAGIADLDARYVIELDDGTRVFVINTAIRRASPEDTQRLIRGEPVDPTRVYFRCLPRFEVAAGPWQWLAESLFVGAGVRRPDRVELAFYRIA